MAEESNIQESKPYCFVSLPKQPPDRHKPIGHQRLRDDRFHGSLSLQLTVQTSSFVASGVVAMGSDLSSQIQNVPLIKLAVQRGNQLVIPGSSLKGVIRSTYEAITRSCLCKTDVNKKNIPQSYQECKRQTSKGKNKLLKICPACQVFGAMEWQGLVSFEDALVEETQSSQIDVGFMPSLYGPRQKAPIYYKNNNKNNNIVGRKFYYHAKEAVEKQQFQGTPIHKIAEQLNLTTQIRFRNLSQAQLGTLFIVLGQHENYPFALKFGGGKPVGMGTMSTQVLSLNKINNLRDRYYSYDDHSSENLTGNDLDTFIKQAIATAHQQLVQKPQLEELQQILAYPTDREAPSGNY